MKALLICLSTLFYIAMNSTALACSCAYGGYWVSDFVKDKTVFEGQAIMTKWLGERPPGKPRFYNSETTFKVKQPFWNVSNEEVKLFHSSQDGASCGINFSMGRNSLVIAYPFKENNFGVSSCTLNAVEEITLINYLENNIDVYIPSWHECSEAQIKNPQDPKNCHYLSTSAAQERSSQASKRRRAIWEKRRNAKKALTLSNETP